MGEVNLYRIDRFAKRFTNSSNNKCAKLNRFVQCLKQANICKDLKKNCWAIFVSSLYLDFHIQGAAFKLEAFVLAKKKTLIKIKCFSCHVFICCVAWKHLTDKHSFNIIILKQSNWEIMMWAHKSRQWRGDCRNKMVFQSAAIVWKWWVLQNGQCVFFGFYLYSPKGHAKRSTNLSDLHSSEMARLIATGVKKHASATRPHCWKNIMFTQCDIFFVLLNSLL